jgi:site-specific recombinase XerD
LDWPYGPTDPKECDGGDSRVLRTPGLDYKHREVGPNTKTRVYVPRLVLGFKADDSSVGRTETFNAEKSSAAVDTVVEVKPIGKGEGPSIVDRGSVGNTVATPKSELIFDGVESDEIRKCQENVLGRQCETEQNVAERPLVVEDCVARKSGEIVGNSTSGSTVLDRCIPIGMGSICDLSRSETGKGNASPRRLGERLVIQQERVSGSAQSTTVFRQSRGDKEFEELSPTFRQYDHSLQYKQVCVGKIISRTDEKAHEFPRESRYDADSGTRQRCEQCEGRQPIQIEPSGRLQFKARSIREVVSGPPGGDYMRSVRIKDQQETSEILYDVPSGQKSDSKGRFFDFVEGFRSTDDSPSDTPIAKEFKESQRRTDTGCSSSTPVVGATMDEHADSDDSEDSDTGSIILSARLRKDNAEEARQTPSREDGSVPSGRINDEGQQMVLNFLAARGLDGMSDLFLGSLASTTLRNYRRGFTLFARILKEIGIDYLSIVTSQIAAQTLVKAVRQAFIQKIKLAAASNMRTAMIRVFSFAFDCNMAESVLVKTAMKFYTVSNLPKKEPLRLSWSIDELFTYIKSLPDFEQMAFNDLTGVTIVLCLAFTTLRFTELANINPFETVPDSDTGVWKLWVKVKGHNCKEPVFLHPVEVKNLNPVKALWELRSRLKDGSMTCWHSETAQGIIPLSYNDLRQAAARVMKAAGVRDNRPYHIKHAVLTCLNQAGASMKEIAAFARHRFGSMAAYEHYISYDGGKGAVQRLVKGIEKKVV